MTLPLARNGILAGLVLAFARALGEFGATLMLAGNIPGKTTTVPLAIYTAVQTGERDEALRAGRRRSRRCRASGDRGREPARRAGDMSDRLEVAIRLQVPGFDARRRVVGGRRRRRAVRALGRGQDAHASVPGRPDHAGRRAHRRRRARASSTRRPGINLPRRHRRVGYVFQGYALFPHLTVADNRRLRPARSPASRAPATRGAGGRAARPRRPRAALSARALGRPAPAGGAGTGAGDRAGAAAARRAAVGARRAAAPRAARRAAAGPERRGAPRRWWSPTTSPRPIGSATASSSTTAGASSSRRRAPSCSGSRRRSRWRGSWGFRNVLHGTVVKATPDRIQISLARPDPGGGQLADALVPAAARQRRSRSSSVPSTCG